MFRVDVSDVRDDIIFKKTADWIFVKIFMYQWTKKTY